LLLLIGHFASPRWSFQYVEHHFPLLLAAAVSLQ